MFGCIKFEKDEMKSRAVGCLQSLLPNFINSPTPEIYKLLLSNYTSTIKSSRLAVAYWVGTIFKSVDSANILFKLSGDDDDEIAGVSIKFIEEKEWEFEELFRILWKEGGYERCR